MIGVKPHATITIDTPMPAPRWALLERQLLDSQTQACREFYERYFDERGYLRCIPRWGGDDGPDDAAENQLNWTILHALGAPDNILTMFRKGWEGHLRQYTEAKTVDVPFARDMILPDMLSAFERNAIDEYHRQVVVKLGPRLTATEKGWLMAVLTPAKTACSWPS